MSTEFHIERDGVPAHDTSDPTLGTTGAHLLRQGGAGFFVDRPPLVVSWVLTSACNYRCSYCFDAPQGYRGRFVDLSQVDVLVDHLLSADRPRYRITLTGGEPTLHPHFIDIIELLHERLQERLDSIVIVSNGSFSDEVIEGLRRLSQQVCISTTLSFHPEFADIHRFTEVVGRLSGHMRVCCNVMLHPEYRTQVRSLIEQLTALRAYRAFDISLDLLREPPSFDSYDRRYTDEDRALVQKAMRRFSAVSRIRRIDAAVKKPSVRISTYEIVQRADGGSYDQKTVDTNRLKQITQHRFSGMTCCAGACTLRIEASGSCRGTLCGTEAALANIYEENPFSLPGWVHGITCPKHLCGCIVDRIIPKFANADDAEAYMARVRSCTTPD